MLMFRRLSFHIIELFFFLKFFFLHYSCFDRTSIFEIFDFFSDLAAFLFCIAGGAKLSLSSAQSFFSRKSLKML